MASSDLWDETMRVGSRLATKVRDTSVFTEKFIFRMTKKIFLLQYCPLSMIRIARDLSDLRFIRTAKNATFFCRKAFGPGMNLSFLNGRKLRLETAWLLK